MSDLSAESRREADAYLINARSWATSQNDLLHRSQRIAWFVALGAAALAVILAIALITLLPLKTVVPYTLLVDRHTGYVQALDPLDASKIAPDRALTQSFLVQYVLAREGFDRATVQHDYRKVMLWSTEVARRDYANLMPVTNPQSPLMMIPKGATIEVNARSVSTLRDGSAMVRFETVRRDRGGMATSAQPWVAIIDYRFSTGPLSTEDRFLNPLGFQVVRYRRSGETLPTLESYKAQPLLPNTPGGVGIGMSERQILSQPGRPRP